MKCGALSLGLLLTLPLSSCRSENRGVAEDRPTSGAAARDTIGFLEAEHPAFHDLVPSYSTIEVLAEGFTWSEGPVWIPSKEHLLFSDVPENTIYRWESGEGLKEWLTPSGDTGYSTGAHEGSNGLLLDAAGRLVLCQHGDRRVSRLEAPFDAPAPAFATLADRFEGARFNSPNDAAFHSSGDLYFTDPPYGLQDASNSELGFQGVYRLKTTGEVELLIDDLARPNGIAFSPDEQTLYVANSDPARAIWMAYDVAENGSLYDERVFFDATSWVASRAGLPDGLKVDVNGNVFATGPGGVLVFSRDGDHLGTIRLPVPAANCAFGDDGRSLYITADMYLLRIRLTTRGRIGPH